MNQQQVEKNAEGTRIPYQQTGFFSKTILDYLAQKEALRPFYTHSFSLSGIQEAIAQRQAFPQQREALVSLLQKQYEGLAVSPNTKSNIALLAHQNTFTITTAHQPVIFTGPLYFAYKILHAVKLAQTLRTQLPQYNFVPVFYMGSEDADLDELGTITVDKKQYKWNTKQTGAVGRMKVDKEFTALLQELQNQISVLPYGNEIIDVFKRCYRLDTTIQQATLEVINELFGEHGVVVLIPDSSHLKRLLVPVFQKEIEEQFSHREVKKTVDQLAHHYKVQAGGRDINLFYLIDDSRERIEKSGDAFIIQKLNLRFTKDELLQELNNHPERFSPNVILRGIMQETALPNIAFIGGGGELAYWLELKNVFAAVSVPYPVLVLRNSFLFITQNQKEKIEETGFSATDFFKDTLTLANELIARTTTHQISIENEKKAIENLFEKLQGIAANADVTLAEHTKAIHAATEKKLMSLQSKIWRAERRKHQEEQRTIKALKESLFPNGSLQERVENISGWYARYGSRFVQSIYQHSLALEAQFSVVTL